jgi:hypothetical protein
MHMGQLDIFQGFFLEWQLDVQIGLVGLQLLIMSNQHRCITPSVV